jgi:predicted Mrr-cat superfamily restriction endonuclease
MQYWLHRISWLANISYPLLEKGYLSIGWSTFSNEIFLEKSSEGEGEYFDKKFEEEYGYLPRNRYSLWHFLAEMNKGDIVIVPSKWGTFSVYKIEEASAILPASLNLNETLADWNGKKINFNRTKQLILEGEKEYLDIGFLRKVKPIQEEISRAEYANSALTKRMKIQNTTANISDLKNDITFAIDAYKKNKPINLKSTLFDKSIDLWLSIIKKELNPDKFEKLILLYFQRVGASNVYIPPKNENDKIGDVDIVAEFEHIKSTICVQVKFHDNETNDWAITQIKESAESKRYFSDGYTTQYWVITSGDSFTEEAERLASENNIILIDGKEFVKMFIDVGIQNITEI